MPRPPDEDFRRDLPFVMTPTWMVLDPTISDEERGAFARLTYFAGAKSTCYPTVEDMAAMSGRSERRERDVLKKLSDRGVVTRTRLIRRGSSFKAGMLYDLRPAWSETNRTKTSGQDTGVEYSEGDEAQVTGRKRPINKNNQEVVLGATTGSYRDRTKTSGDSPAATGDEVQTWVDALESGDAIPADVPDALARDVAFKAAISSSSVLWPMAEALFRRCKRADEAA